MSDPYASDGPPTVPTHPSASGVYTATSITYASSLDAVTGLFAYLTWDDGVAAALPGAMPILVLVHGYTGDANSFDHVDRERYASYGFLVITVGLRSNNGATGAKDASGREILDIWDAVAAVRIAHAAVASPTQAAIVGYSGGGGNAMHCLLKLPELFAVHAWLFPVTDYGYLTSGWYNYQGVAPTYLDADIGLRSTHENEYRTRFSSDAAAAMMANVGLTWPYVYLFNDTADAVLSPATQAALIAAFISAGVSSTRYAWNQTTVLDPVRWYHDVPQGHTDLIQAEYYWVRRAREAAAWTMPPAGSIQVLGWIRFGTVEIWLGDAASPRTTGGLNRTATLAYDTVTGTYVLTPQLGATHVYLRDGARTAPAFSSSRTCEVDVAAGTVDEVGNDLDGAVASPAWAAGATTSWAPAAFAPHVVSTAAAKSWAAIDRRTRTSIAP